MNQSSQLSWSRSRKRISLSTRRYKASIKLGRVLLFVILIGGCTTENQTTATSEIKSKVTTTTTRPRIVTTTERVTTTTAISPGESKDIQILTVAYAMKSTQRATFIDAIESNSVLERVDVFEVDVLDGTESTPGSITLRVEGSSGYQTEEFQIKKVWELVSSLALFWETGEGIFRNDEGLIKPALVIVVDGRTYCSMYNVMVELADRRISQRDWFAVSRE